MSDLNDTTQIYTGGKTKSAVVESKYKRARVLNPKTDYTPKVNDLIGKLSGKHQLFTDEADVVPVGVIESYNSETKKAIIGNVGFYEVGSLNYGEITNAENAENLLRTYSIHLDGSLTQKA